jgi:hypothetical protein
MELPSVVHPTVFGIRGYRLQVVTYFAVSNEQAALIAQVAFRQRKWLKKDQGKTHTLLWTGDRAALEQLEAAAANARDTLRDLLAPTRSRR